MFSTIVILILSAGVLGAAFHFLHARYSEIWLYYGILSSFVLIPIFKLPLTFFSLIPLLLVVTYIDFEYKVIPNYLIILTGIGTYLTCYFYSLPVSILSMLILPGIYIALNLLFMPLKMLAYGAGDIKLSFFLGALFTPFQVLQLFVISQLLAALFVIARRLFFLVRKRKAASSTIAFGPYLAVSTLVVYILSIPTLSAFRSILVF